MTTDWRDALLSGVASTGGLAVAVALLLVVVLRWLLPPSSRAALKLPAGLIFVHVALLVVRQFLPEPHEIRGTLDVAGVFVLLAALGRLAFLLCVTWFLGVRLKRPLPTIFADIIQVLVYLVVALVTLRSIGVELGSLLTTSALLTAVIGLSMQETLGNLFAGLALQAERPFQVGDWIQFDADEALIGKVKEINWRATKIVTNNAVEVVVPNSILAKTPIRNYSRPSIVVRRSVSVQSDYGVAPGRVHRALRDAVERCPRVLRDPAPFSLTQGFADSGIDYQLRYFIDDFESRANIDSEVRSRIWYAFQRSGIPIPFPIRDVRIQPPPAGEKLEEGVQLRLDVLRGVEFFDVLPEAALRQLAQAAEVRDYEPDEPIVRQGEEGSELYVIHRGEVVVVLEDESGTAQELAHLGPGRVFGELSLVSGERRTATIRATTTSSVLAIDQASFMTILEQAPELRQRITDVLGRRQTELADLAARSQFPAANEAVDNALLQRLRQFFSL